MYCEVNTANNVLVDGQVTLLSRPAQRFTFSYLLVLIYLLILFASVVLAMFLVTFFYLKRKRKKKPRRSYTIIVHPHV